MLGDVSIAKRLCWQMMTLTEEYGFRICVDRKTRRSCYSLRSFWVGMEWCWKGHLVGHLRQSHTTPILYTVPMEKTLTHPSWPSKQGVSQLNKIARWRETSASFVIYNRISIGGIARFLRKPSCDRYIYSGNQNIHFKVIWWAERGPKEMTFLRDMCTNPGKLKQYLFVQIISKNFLESNLNFSGMDWINLRRSWHFF